MWDVGCGCGHGCWGCRIQLVGCGGRTSACRGHIQMVCIGRVGVVVFFVAQLVCVGCVKWGVCAGRVGWEWLCKRCRGEWKNKAVVCR